MNRLIVILSLHVSCITCFSQVPFFTIPDLHKIVTTRNPEELRFFLLENKDFTFLEHRKNQDFTEFWAFSHGNPTHGYEDVLFYFSNFNTANIPLLEKQNGKANMMHYTNQIIIMFRKDNMDNYSFLIKQLNNSNNLIIKQEQYNEIKKRQELIFTDSSSGILFKFWTQDNVKMLNVQYKLEDVYKLLAEKNLL